MKLTDLSQYTGNWDEEEWKRLGVILGHNIYVEELKLIGDNRQNLNVSDLFIGLQMNKHISKLSLVGINLGGNSMNKLAPFLSNNPLLKKIDLSGCNIGTASIDILSNALLRRSEDTLENIDLNENNFGDINLDMLVRPLIKCSRLKLLLLRYNYIGINGCTSLANLLKNGESNLAHMDLSNNLIDNKCFIALTISLAGNKKTKLKTLQLWGNNGITASGWVALLKLVCNFSSINNVVESNHNLHNMPTTLRILVRTLGIDDAHLLQSCLKMNTTINKLIVTRQKIIWSHARGDLNVGDSTISTSLLPRIISWFVDDFHEQNVNLIQYNDPPIQSDKVDATRFDSVFRIVKSRPDLCQYYSPHCIIPDRITDTLHSFTNSEKELWHCLTAYDLLWNAHLAARLETIDVGM